MHNGYLSRYKRSRRKTEQKVCPISYMPKKQKAFTEICASVNNFFCNLRGKFVWCALNRSMNRPNKPLSLYRLRENENTLARR